VFFARGTQQGDGEMEISWAASPVVTGVQATPRNTAVSISWDESRLTSLTAYRVYGGTTANPTTLLDTVLAGTLGYTHTGLTNGTVYYYRVAPIVTINGQTREAPLSGDVSAIPTSLTSVTITASGAVNAFTVPAGVSWLQFDAAGGQGAQGCSGIGG
jgi:hypothetical protein